MSEAVAMQAVSRRFEVGGHRVDAVRGIDLSVREGELVAVLGRSGSGKTTLLSLAGGLDRPDAGQVSVGGQVLGALDEAGLDEFRRRTVGWVFQTSGLLPLLTATENVALALRIQGVPEARAGRMALAACRRSGWPSGPPIEPTSSPAASSSGRRWRGRWSSTRACCWRTSPRASSTARPRRRS